MARLDVLGGGNAPTPISPPTTPNAQNDATRTQSPIIFETPTTPITPNSDDSKCSDITNVPKKVVKIAAVSILEEKPFVVPDSFGASSSKTSKTGQTRSDSEASSIHMEVDEHSCNEKGANTDIDSGIENMEVVNRSFWENIDWSGGTKNMSRLFIVLCSHDSYKAF